MTKSVHNLEPKFQDDRCGICDDIDPRGESSERHRSSMFNCTSESKQAQLAVVGAADTGVTNQRQQLKISQYHFE